MTILRTFFFLCGAVLIATAQVPLSFQKSIQSTPSNTKLLTKIVNDIVIVGDTIWLATELGISYTPRGEISWVNLANTATFDSKGISALAVRNNTIWAATGYTTSLGDASVITGGGFHVSTDHGQTWSYIPQPVDVGRIDTLRYGQNIIRALAITVPQQNITYDIALTSSAVWIASWAGMLRKSTDNGQTWERVVLPPDNLDEIDTAMTLSFDLSPVQKIFTRSDGRLDTLKESHNHKVFAVYASSDSVLWVGTANGINRSTDGGVSWKKFSHQNQAQPISGNFVVAITEQRWKNKRILWAATNNAVDPNEQKAVSFSDDDGATWKTALHGLFIHNIAWKDSLVYVATSDGIFRTSDFGNSWVRNGTIYDAQTLQRFTDNEIYCVGVAGDTVWIGGTDGVAYTLDSPVSPFGTEWHILRVTEDVGTKGYTYAYPNPFSPDLQVTRFHYSTKNVPAGTSEVTLRIFNFAMQPVRTLLSRAPRAVDAEYDELWDGRDDRGSVVANGVYFYSVTINNSTPLWGKIMVVR